MPNTVPIKDQFNLQDSSAVKFFAENMQKAIDLLDLEQILYLSQTARKRLLEQYADLEKANPQLFEKIKDVIAHGEWYVLGRLPVTNLPELFEKHFAYYWQQDPDLVFTLLQNRLAIIPDVAKRDQIKASIRLALARATALLGKNNLDDAAGNSAAPSVANWLRDWREFLADRPLDPLLIVEYLNSSKNVKKLTVTERKQLELVIKLDHKLSLSSQSAEGTEDTYVIKDPVSGTYKIFERGKLYDSKVAISAEELEAMRYVYDLNEKSGKPLSLAQVVKREVRYAQPQQVVAKPKAQPKPTPAPLASKPVKPVSKKSFSPPKVTLPPPPPLPTALKPLPKTKISSTSINYHQLAQRVLSYYELLFPTLEGEQHFLSIVAGYLRKTIDLKKAQNLLSASVEEGGALLASNKTAEILKTADEILNEVKTQPQANRLSLDKLTKSSQFAPSFQAVQKQMKKQEIHHAEESAEGAIEDIFANINPIFDNNPPAVNSNFTVKAKKPLVRDVLEPVTTKPVADQPLVMGPIDELAHLTLLEFRRLGGTSGSAEAVKKLKEKLQLLEDESIAKRAEGIEAWKTSPLNQLYVNIGNSSLDRNIPVNKVIAEKLAQKEESLTAEEFSAVADFNRLIRY